MAFTAGDFSAGDHYTQVVKKFMEFWGTDAIKKRWKLPMPCFNQLATAQTQVQFMADDPLSDPRKCQDIKVIWLDTPTDIDPVAIVSNDYCDWTGTEGSANTTSYTIDAGFQTPFAVVETACKDRFDYEEKVADRLGEALFKMDQEMEKRMLSFVIASGDDVSAVDPELPIGNSKVGDATIWEVPAASNITVIQHFENFANDIYMEDPVHLAGNKWRFEQNVYSRRESGVYNDDRDVLLNTQFPLFRSTHILDTLTATPLNWLVVDRAAMLYYNTTYEQSLVPVDKGGEKRMMAWKIASPRHSWYNPVTRSVQPVFYDIRMKRECSARHEWTSKFMLEHNGGYMKAPQGRGGQPTFLQIEFN